MVQIEEFFYGWMPIDWVMFGVGFVVIFGLLNGVYSISRLIRKGSVPTVYWVLNGVLAGFAAMFAVATL